MEPFIVTYTIMNIHPRPCIYIFSKPDVVRPAVLGLVIATRCSITRPCVARSDVAEFGVARLRVSRSDVPRAATLALVIVAIFGVAKCSVTRPDVAELGVARLVVCRPDVFRPATLALVIVAIFGVARCSVASPHVDVLGVARTDMTRPDVARPGVARSSVAMLGNICHGVARLVGRPDPQCRFPCAPDQTQIPVFKHSTKNT